MANTIKIKAGSGTPTTSNIADRELAFDRSANKLYINDAGSIVELNPDANSGDITSVVAGSGLTGGATSGAATLNIGAGTGIDVAADAISVDVSDFMSNGSNDRILTATGTDAMNAEANLTFTPSNNYLVVHEAGSSTGSHLRLSTDNSDFIFSASGASNQLSIYDVNATANSLVMDSNGKITLRDSLKIPVGKSVFFGASEHTYIREDIDDRLRFFTGGVEYMRFTEGSSDLVNIYKDTYFGERALWAGGLLNVLHSTHGYISNTSGHLFIRQQMQDGDIYFEVNDGGSTINAIQIDASDNGSVFLKNDNQYLFIGAGNDIALGHNGTNSFLNNNTGTLQIRNLSSDQDITFSVNDGGSQATALQIDASNYGSLVLPLDNQNLYLGAANDFRIVHNGTDTYLNNHTGDFIIQNFADDKDISLRSDDGSGGSTPYLTLDGSAGYTKANKHILYLDNVQAFFGTGGDLIIKHDGSNSYISHNVTGDFYIQQNQADKDLVLQCDNGSGGTTAYLTLDGSAGYTKANKHIKFLDDVKGIFGDSSDLQIYHVSNASYISNGTGMFTIRNTAQDQDIRFSVNDGGSTSNILTLNAASSRVGINNTSPSYTLDVAGDIRATGDLRASDDMVLDVNNNFLYARDASNTMTRVLGINSSNNFYIGPIDNFAGGSVLIGTNSNITDHYLYTQGTYRLRVNQNYVYASNKLYVPDGSASAPTLGFLQDTNTGFYRPTSDMIGFTTGGSARLLLNSSGPNFINNTGLYMDYRRFFDLQSNSNDRGVWNPIASSIRNSGIQRHFDEEFEEGTNGVNLYNNSGGSNLVLSRITASADSIVPPNKTGKVMKIAYNGNGTVSPNFGGIYQTISSEENHTFVQLFQAKLPDGRYFVINENAQGTRNTSYFLTDHRGTGKWEWYARVSHCGDSGSFSSGGHISVGGGSDAAFNWYIASMTQYDVTESPYNYSVAGKGSSGQLLKADGDGTYSWQSQGGGSNLDADKLDGIQASQFLRSDAADTATGALTLGTQTWNGHITWNNGMNIGVAGESSFDVSGTGYFQIWDSGTGSPFIKCDVGETVEIGQAGARGLKVYGDIKLATATNKLYLDGGSNTFIHENAADTIGFATNGVTRFTMNSGGDLYVSNKVQAGGNGIEIWDSTHGFKQVLGKTSTYTTLLNNDGSVCIHMGDSGDGNNYYNNGSHIFRSASGSNYATINSTGITHTSSSAFTMGNIANKIRIQTDGVDDFSFLTTGNAYANTLANNVYAASKLETAGYTQVTKTGTTGTLLRLVNSGWTNGTTHDIILNGYVTTLGDYTYLKSAGNSANTHGMLLNSDNYLFWGRDNLTTGAVDNSATAPMTDVCMRVDASGNALFDGDVVAYSSTIASDERLKENVEDLNYGLKDVLDMRAVSFDWIDKRNGQHDIGVIAQEIEKIIPEVVVEVDTLNSENTHKTVDYAKLTSVLITAIQEQQVQIDELKTKLGE